MDEIDDKKPTIHHLDSQAQEVLSTAPESDLPVVLTTCNKLRHDLHNMEEQLKQKQDALRGNVTEKETLGHDVKKCLDWLEDTLVAMTANEPIGVPVEHAKAAQYKHEVSVHKKICIKKKLREKKGKNHKIKKMNKIIIMQWIKLKSFGGSDHPHPQFS